MGTTNDGSKNQDPESALLEEGVGSYVQAVGAILAFRMLVKNRCRQVVQKRLKEYGAALGATVTQDQIRDYQGPSEAKWGDDWASIGVEIHDVGAAKVCLYHTLGWTAGDAGNWAAVVGVSVWFQQSGHAALLLDAFRPHPEGLDFWDRSRALGCSRELPHGQAATFDAALDELLGQWIALWKRAGGLKAIEEE